MNNTGDGSKPQAPHGVLQLGSAGLGILNGQQVLVLGNEFLAHTPAPYEASETSLPAQVLPVVLTSVAEEKPTEAPIGLDGSCLTIINVSVPMAAGSEFSEKTSADNGRTAEVEQKVEVPEQAHAAGLPCHKFLAQDILARSAGMQAAGGLYGNQAPGGLYPDSLLLGKPASSQLFTPRRADQKPLGHASTAHLTAKERNRLAQKRFRERQKAMINGLQSKVAELTALVRIYQSELDKLRSDREAMLVELKRRGIRWPPQ